MSWTGLLTEIVAKNPDGDNCGKSFVLFSDIYLNNGQKVFIRPMSESCFPL